MPKCRDYREPPSKFRVAAKRENPATHARRCTPQHRQLNCSQKCSKSQSYILAANTKPSTSCVEMGWSSQECCCFSCFIQPCQPKPRHRCIVKTRFAFQIKHSVIGKQARHATQPLKQLTSRGSKNKSTSVEKLDSLHLRDEQTPKQPALAAVHHHGRLSRTRQSTWNGRRGTVRHLLQ